MKNEFEQFTEKVSANEAHNQEIQATRVGGLGGSDAAMLLRIGHGGMEALTNTDMKRLAVMLGRMEQADFGGNEYTEAGHAFEDFAERNLTWGSYGYEREKKLEAGLAKGFKTFAHADFVTGLKHLDVVECKYSQKATDEVLKIYAAQLQWYYMLGARNVMLYHGTGSVPFDEDELSAEVVPVPRDEETIKALKAGIKTLDKELAKGWEPVIREKVGLEVAPVAVVDAFVTLEELKEQEAEMKAAQAEAKGVIMEYMDAFGLVGITNEVSGRQVVLTKAKTQQRFDLKTFKGLLMKAEEGCTFTVDEVLAMVEKAMKTTEVSASISLR